MTAENWIKRFIIFIICLNVILPSFISEVAIPNDNPSQDNLLIKTGENNPINQKFTINSPTHVTPEDGALTNDRTVYIEWSRVALASDYNLQVDDDPNFASPIVDVRTGSGSAVSYTTQSLADNIYYWRVRNLVTFVWGAWSDPWQFEVDGTPPPPPSLVSPSNGYHTNDNTIYFDWNPSFGANWYLLQVDDNPTFMIPAISHQTSNTHYQAGSLSQGTWYWRVRARDAAMNWGPWSVETRTVTIDTTPPGAPELIAPSDLSASNDNTPFLDWSAVSTATLYQAIVAIDSDFSPIEFEIFTAGTSYTTTPLSDGVKYWRVRARDSALNWGPWSSGRQFTIDTEPPSPPAPITPDDGLIDSNNTMFLDWAASSTAKQYNLVVGNDSSFTSKAVNIYTANTSYTTSTLLDGEYYWHIRARDFLGNWGSWSTSRSFIVDTTAPEITNVTQNPETPTDAEMVTIKCNVTDLNGVNTVYLYYRTQGETDWLVEAMLYDTGNAYTATIGSFSYGLIIEYYINATDVAATPNNGIANNSGLFYSFTVVSSDTTPPTFTYSSHTPFNPNDTEKVTFICDVSDASDIQFVRLYYRINGGSFTSALMTHDSGDTYNASVGPFNYGSFVEFYFTATDDSPNHNLAIDNNGGSFYSFSIASSDLTVPTINSVTINPTIIYITDSVNITCYAYDASGLQSVSLYYMVNADNIWTKVDMILLSGNIYGVILEPFAANDKVSFYIEAIDDSVAENTVAEDNEGTYYNFEVQQITLTSPISYIIPMIAMFSILAILRKRK